MSMHASTKKSYMGTKMLALKYENLLQIRTPPRERERERAIGVGMNKGCFTLIIAVIPYVNLDP